MKDTRPAKTVIASARETIDRVFSNDLNPLGRIGGWRIMEIADKLGGTVAQKHSGLPPVTKKADFDFKGPARLGEVLQVKAQVTAVWTSSCMVFVTVLAEDIRTQSLRLVGTAWLLFVALDKNTEQPIPIPYRLTVRNEKQRCYRKIAEMKKRHWLEEDKEVAELLKIEIPD